MGLEENMDRKNEKRRKGWQRYLVMILFCLLGFACGILFAHYVDTTEVSETSGLGGRLISLGLMLLELYLAVFLQIIVHEGGHLVCGLISGYTFSSFRIADFMWIKENGKIQLRRFSIAGTGGQCLMAPPKMKDGKIPVTLYNMGGALMNLIVSGICLAAALFMEKNSMPAIFLFMTAAIGVVFAATNGIPMRMGEIDNDGYNAMSLGKNPDALRAFWVQMQANAQVAKGIRLKDMPEEWFALPSDAAMKNSLIAAVGVFACNRLMDERRFDEADRLMEHMLDLDTGMPGLYRSLLICDRMYCEMIRGNRKEVLDGMLDKQQKKFMKAMKKYPSVIRTEYAYALLAEKDPVKARSVREAFDKYMQKYPYPSEAKAERELMEKAKEMVQ